MGHFRKRQCDKVAFKGIKYYTLMQGHSFLFFAPLRSGHELDLYRVRGIYADGVLLSGLDSKDWFAVRPALQLLLLKAQSIILKCKGLSFYNFGTAALRQTNQYVEFIRFASRWLD